MTEAEISKLPHPTPQHIQLCVLDELWAEFGASLPYGVTAAVRRGVKRANEEFHNEPA